MFGLKNIADAAGKPADGGYPELSQEYIVTARPQLIFLADNSPPTAGRPRRSSPSGPAGRAYRRWPTTPSSD